MGQASLHSRLGARVVEEQVGVLPVVLRGHPGCRVGFYLDNECPKLIRV